MAQLRQDNHLFEELEAKIIVVGPEGPQEFIDYWAKNELPFIGLPDPTHHVLKLYGQEVKLFKMGRMPAMLIIDKSGYVRFVHYGHEMSDIPENDQVLDLIKSLKESL
jgi:peroxiredoxin Q/BCP